MQNRLFSILLIVLIAKEAEGGRSAEVTEILPRCHNSPFAHSAPSESCWGVPSPNPALPLRAKEKRLNRICNQSVNFSKRGVRFLPIFLEVYEEVFTRARYMGANNRKEVKPMSRKQYDTPRRKRIVKTRLTEEEYANFAARLAPYVISQSEFIRRAIRKAVIRPVVYVSPVNDELLSGIGTLTAEYGRIGSNLNQIARTLNEWHSPYPQLAGEVRSAASDLAALKFEVLEQVGEAVGNVQAYQL